MSSWINLSLVLNLMSLNQFKGSAVQRHCFSLRSVLILLLICCSSCRLIWPMLDFAGFISLHLSVFGKSLLWSLMVKYDGSRTGLHKMSLQGGGARITPLLNKASNKQTRSVTQHYTAHTP